MTSVPLQRICANLVCSKVFTPRPTNVAQGAGFYCCLPCARANRPRKPIAERFWAKVLLCKHGPECPYCCWPWQGHLDQDGYGVLKMKIDGKWRGTRAH